MLLPQSLKHRKTRQQNRRPTPLKGKNSSGRAAGASNVNRFGVRQEEEEDTVRDEGEEEEEQMVENN